MSGIRVNEWLHNSGTGGIWQTSAGNVGIASSVPTTKLEVTGDAKISGVTTATAFIPSAGQLGNRNLIINGAMQVAQRGTSSTTSGFGSLDRWDCRHNGADEAPTHSQHALTSSDTGPWEKGLRYSYHMQNGNQTGGAGAGDYNFIFQSIEAQNLACSGWEYTSTSSYITLSFWVKSSVAQNFYGYLRTLDGTAQSIPYETGALSANTWKYVTVTFSGNSNITVDNDNNLGMRVYWSPFQGTDYTANSKTVGTWSPYVNAERHPDETSTWWTTNDATFEITGVQLEVGSVATPFEHRSYGDEFLRCARYYQEQQGGSDVFMYAAKAQGSTTADIGVGLVVPLRGSPTVTCSSHRLFQSDAVAYTSSSTAPTVVQWDDAHSIHSATIALNAGGHSGITNNECCTWAPSAAALTFDSEI